MSFISPNPVKFQLMTMAWTSSDLCWPAFAVIEIWDLGVIQSTRAYMHIFRVYHIEWNERRELASNTACFGFPFISLAAYNQLEVVTEITPKKELRPITTVFLV